LTEDFGQDVGTLQDCERIVTEAKDGLGGLDVIISNAVSCLGLSPFSHTLFRVDFPEARRKLKFSMSALGRLGVANEFPTTLAADSGQGLDEVHGIRRPGCLQVCTSNFVWMR